jgi:hypothetical protein
MTLKLTILAPAVSIRSTPAFQQLSTDDVNLGVAKAGDQFDVINLFDKKAPEQWAKIVLPGQEATNAFICVIRPDGSRMGTLNNAPDRETSEYTRGWNDCLDATHRALVNLRK